MKGPARFVHKAPTHMNKGGSMSGVWLVVKSTAITMVLGLLMAGWAQTVWALTQGGAALR